jgi:hypothetical protein
LLLRHLISDEQWLAALAEHWSSPGASRRTIGSTIVAAGFLRKEDVERAAREFHDEIEVVEIVPRSERTTLPIVPAASPHRA